MGRLRLFGELVEAGGAVEGGGGGGGHQIARVVRTSGDYTTNSTSWADIDTANLVINMTTGDSWVLLMLLGSLYTDGFHYGYFDFTIDGTRQGQSKGVLLIQANMEQDLQLLWLAHLSPGAHVFRPQWKVDTAGGCHLYARTSMTPLLFAVLELQ